MVDFRTVVRELDFEGDPTEESGVVDVALNFLADVDDEDSAVAPTLVDFLGDEFNEEDIIWRVIDVE